MTELEHVDRAPAVNVDEQTLRYLGYDPGNVATRALVLLAEKYELDPLLHEIELIKTKSGVKPYVTRDGMLVVAHRSGFLDGIVVEQQRRNTTDDGWTAYVSVWRRDMSHPFTYGAQCKDTEDQAKSGNGPEQALARAERRALKRAFQIRTPDDELEFDAGTVPAAAAVPASAQVPAPDRHVGVARSGDWDPDGTAPVASTAVDARPAPVLGDWTPTDDDLGKARTAVTNMPVKERIRFLSKHGIDHFGEPWPPEAVAEVLAGPPDVSGTRSSDAGPASDPVPAPGEWPRIRPASDVSGTRSSDAGPASDPVPAPGEWPPIRPAKS